MIRSERTAGFIGGYLRMAAYQCQSRSVAGSLASVTGSPIPCETGAHDPGRQSRTYRRTPNVKPFALRCMARFAYFGKDGQAGLDAADGTGLIIYWFAA